MAHSLLAAPMAKNSGKEVLIREVGEAGRRRGAAVVEQGVEIAVANLLPDPVGELSCNAAGRRTASELTEVVGEAARATISINFDPRSGASTAEFEERTSSGAAGWEAESPGPRHVGRGAASAPGAVVGLAAG